MPLERLDGVVRSATFILRFPLLADHNSAVTPASSCAVKVPCRCTSMLVSVYPPVLLPVVNACAWAEKKLPLFPPAVCPVLLTSTAAAAGAAANGDSAASSSARTGRGRKRRARARPPGASGRQWASRWSRSPRGATRAAGPLGRWAAGPLGRWAAGPLGRWERLYPGRPSGGTRCHCFFLLFRDPFRSRSPLPATFPAYPASRRDGCRPTAHSFRSPRSVKPGLAPETPQYYYILSIFEARRLSSAIAPPVPSAACPLRPRAARRRLSRADQSRVFADFCAATRHRRRPATTSGRFSARPPGSRGPSALRRQRRRRRPGPIYPDMKSAHACMTGRRFSSRSSRA